MSLPVKPPAPDPNQILIHISSPSAPEEITAQAAKHDLHIKYVAPVGELSGEHWFELRASGGVALVKRDEDNWGKLGTEAVDVLKRVEGVRGASLQEKKMRAKR